MRRAPRTGGAGAERVIRTVWLVTALAGLGACRSSPPPARHVVLITIDTLRADAVGAYGSGTARTPTLDALARDGARFDRAWATAPITLTSHASLLTGLYPPAHGARHNGIALKDGIATLATALKGAGFDTAAFVSAFPLDRRFGLARGFDVYDDELPRSSAGLPQNERAGAETVDRAIAWLRTRGNARLFLWVHLFEPHAPYGLPGSGGSARARYGEEVTMADQQAGRLLDALGDRTADALVIATGDHGEAFGEHGEIGHSIFVYDTTLRVPLVMRGPRVPRGAVVTSDVSLIDIAATIRALTGIDAVQPGAGVSLAATVAGEPLPNRAIYAESFAPLVDFGWASLRAVREGTWKYIGAPRPELFDLARDPGEATNLAASRIDEATRLNEAATEWSGAELDAVAAPAPDVAARLGSLGYVGGMGRPTAGTSRPDPKDRIDIAAVMAMVTSGELTGDARIAALQDMLHADPGNPQAHLRLGYAELERDRCLAAIPHLQAALDAHVPSADAGLGLADCLGRSGDVSGAERALNAGLAAEPGNPVALANLGILALEQGRPGDAIPRLRDALQREPRLLPARFALARALARAGDRAGALAEALDLLARLPPGAPQRPEVERLVTALK
jgi:cytochrome c-type biogenesis protein CcmH/NrfG